VRNNARMSTKDFKTFQTLELTAARMREAAKSGVRISEAEAYAQYENANSQATVRVAQLSSDWFARYLTATTDEAVQVYAAGHAPEVDTAFATAEASYTEGCPLVSEIFFEFPPASDEADEAATRARAERVAAQAARASSAEFELLARLHSAAPSASHGGQRGCLQASEGEESAQFVTAVEGLAPGAVSKLLEVPRGFQLFRLEQRLTKDDAASVGRLSVARPLAVRAAADALTLEFAEALKAGIAGGKSMQEALDALLADALKKAPASASQVRRGAQPSELEAAALESRDRPQIEVSSSFSRVGMANPIPNASAGSAVKQLAFTLQAAGDVYPEPIPTRDGLAVLQLKEKQPAKREEFDKEKGEFLRELKDRAEADALLALVTRLRKEHASEISINERFLDAKDKAGDDS
jgi:parvulin-like peptidyl-prolyl isomerase